MTQTLIEQLEKLIRTGGVAGIFRESSHVVLSSDLRAIIEQHKSQPDIVAELVKALEDDAYAASFQSMAGYRTALIAKVKGVVG